MKLDVIRDNLTLCEQALEEGQTQAAVEHACNTVRLLLQRTAQWQDRNGETDDRKNYIALVGVAGAVQSQLEVLTRKQDPAQLPQKLRDRIGQIRQEFADAQEAYQTLSRLHKELLSEEEALLEEKKKRDALKEKTEKLLHLKEQELVQLQEKLEQLSKKLNLVEQECTSCESLYLTVEQELEENLSLLANLPEATGSSVLDVLIAQSRQQKQILETARESSGEPLRKIIEKVRQLEAMAEGKV